MRCKQPAGEEPVIFRALYAAVPREGKECPYHRLYGSFRYTPRL